MSLVPRRCWPWQKARCTRQPPKGRGAVQLAARGAELVLACRDLGRGERTADDIARRTGAKSCVVLRIDTSSQQSIREFARQYRERYPRLDVLINNAGINRSQRQTSVDGVELTFATNVLGYYLLTRELLDLLRASAPARIVNVASTFASDLDLADLQFERRAYVGRRAYSQSKACDRMLTWALARRLSGTGVTANAMHPGFVATEIFGKGGGLVSLGASLYSKLRGLRPEEGADTVVWLAASPEVEGRSGLFWISRQERRCRFRDEAGEEALWALCRDMTRPA